MYSDPINLNFTGIFTAAKCRSWIVDFQHNYTQGLPSHIASLPLRTVVLYARVVYTGSFQKSQGQ